MPRKKSDSRLSLRLTGQLKRTIEDGAAQMGLTVSNFAISTLVQASRRSLHEQQVTRLSERDGQRFSEMLEDRSTRPNEALTNAAKRNKEQIV